VKDHPVIAALLIVASVFALFVLSVVVLVSYVGRQEPYISGAHVGVIEVSGLITSGKPVIDKLIQFRKDPEVKAVVLRVDSPGGEVGPSQEIYEEVRKTAKVKKVVASLGGVAASGGYYIASACDRIISNPGTITGSIGVIIEFSNVEGLLKKIGVTADVVKSGTFKDIGSPVRPMTAEERSLVQGVIDSVHQQFIKAVSDGRRMPVEKVRAIADGRIMSGAQAKALGLVDSLGGLQDAIETAGRLGGIKGEVEAVYIKKEPFSLWNLVFGEDAEGAGNLLQRAVSDYQLRYLMPALPSTR
jgi:protease-4